MTTLTVPAPAPSQARLVARSGRARADVGVVVAFAGSVQLRHHADLRVVGRQLRAKAHQAMARDRGPRRTVEREVVAGAYANLPAWRHADQWLTLAERAAVVWFPEQLHRQVRAATVLKFAALVAAHADDATGRRCWRWYPDLARALGVTVETVRKCWRALERLGLAVQVEPSVCFGYDQRMRLWRQGSKQRGMTPEYALVAPAAFVRALESGEHPADLLALEPATAVDDVDDADGGHRCEPQPATAADRLLAALRALQAVRGPGPVPMVRRPAGAATAAPEPTAAPVAPVSPTPLARRYESPSVSFAWPPVENRLHRSSDRLRNVDILDLPRSGTRPSYSSCLALVTVVPHGVKSTASRAQNRRSSADPARRGGPPSRKAPQRRQAGRGGWFGPHRDIAVYLTRRVLWLRHTRPGRIAMQLRRFTVPGLPRVWRPIDFVTAFETINHRQGRYSPGANLVSASTADQAHAAKAAAGAVTSPSGLLRWYLEQLDPVNDHPRFELDHDNHRRATEHTARRAQAARDRAATTRLEVLPDRAAWEAARRDRRTRQTVYRPDHRP